MAADYHPCFASVPDSWQGRWAAVREFTRRWYDLTIRPVGTHSALIDAEESKLGRQLPPSFREWVTFAGDLMAYTACAIEKGEPVAPEALYPLRDVYEVIRLERQGAVSLMLQYEGDVYWAVKEEDLGGDDPPVHSYEVSGDEHNWEQKDFAYQKLEAPTIPGFVLGHMVWFLRHKAGGFCVPLKPSPEFLSEMRRAFPVATVFGHLQIFEAENLFVAITPPDSAFETHLMHVNVWRRIPRAQIPACVLAYATQDDYWSD
jgi:hypothetical protein